MLRKVPTLLVLATFLAIGACDDEIITDAIPEAGSASDAAKEGSVADGASASTEAASEGGTSTGDGSASESAAPDGGSKPDAPSGDGGTSEGGTEAGTASDAAAATDAPPG